MERCFGLLNWIFRLFVFVFILGRLFFKELIRVCELFLDFLDVKHNYFNLGVYLFRCFTKVLEFRCVTVLLHDSTDLLVKSFLAQHSVLVIIPIQDLLNEIGK